MRIRNTDLDVSICVIDGCPQRVNARGMCSKHYLRWKRHGDPSATPGTLRGEPMAYLLAVLTTRPACTAGRWLYSRNPHGYGMVRYEGRQIGVHALVCTWYHGPRPPGKIASHRCGKGHLGCFSPDCLYWATRQEDARDRVDHGTQRNPGTKLTPAQVDEIRARYTPQHWRRPSTGPTYEELAADYGVSKVTIFRVLHHRNW